MPIVFLYLLFFWILENHHYNIFTNIVDWYKTCGAVPVLTGGLSGLGCSGVMSHNIKKTITDNNSVKPWMLGANHAAFARA